MRWGKKRIAGKDYDLGHLDPFTLKVTPKVEGADTYVVRTTFGFHTFTRDLTEEDKPDLHITHQGEKRCFCTDRYDLSRELPDLIRYASGGRVYFSQRANFLIVESLADKNAPYVAFFRIEKAKKADGYDVAMFVTSAHLRPALPDRLPAITFATLVDYTYQQKALTRPVARIIIPVKRK